MDHCDALVVGSGPAGSSCAWWLSRAELDVQVLDKQSFPRDKVCAGWVTPAVFETLGIDTGVPDGYPLVRNTCFLLTPYPACPIICLAFVHTIGAGTSIDILSCH